MLLGAGKTEVSYQSLPRIEDMLIRMLQQNDLSVTPINPSNGFWQVPSPAYGIAGNFTKRAQAR